MNKYFSQYNQDKFVNEVIFAGRRNGFFIDIGAHDGISFSNSYFFEKEKKWKGICIEPNPPVFDKLKKNRDCIVYNFCVGDSSNDVTFWKIEGYAEMLSGIVDFYDQRHIDRVNTEIRNRGGSITEIEVQVKNLDSIVELNQQTVDFLSIDTEGNEFYILKSIDFEKIKISAITVENNYNDLDLPQFLNKKGFTKLIRLGSDEIYLKSDLISIQIKFKIFLWRLRQKFHSIFALVRV